ncbi:MAG: SMI1/KNR4 family protein [Gemmatimonas sp.]
MSLTEQVLALDRLAYVNSDEEEQTIELLPGLSPAEIDQLAAEFPCAIPEELRALVARTAGISSDAHSVIASPTDTVSFRCRDALRFLGSDEGPYRDPRTYPCICWPVLASDDCGNFWTVDLRPDSREWGPIYYVCHDPAVIVYQARDLGEFVTQLRALLFDKDDSSPIARVKDHFRFEVYRGRSATLDHAAMLAGDDAMRAFATKLGPAYNYVDLRRAEIGHGVTLMHDPVERHGHERLFAYRTPVSLWNKLFGRAARPPT